MDIGKKIREAREKKGLTQQQLAKKTGFSQTAITHYEINKRNPTPQKLKKIADALGKDINYFYYDPPRKDTIKDKEKSEIWDLVMSLDNEQKEFALGCLRMLKEGKAKDLREFEEVFQEYANTLKLTKENEIMIKKLLFTIKATGQQKLEALVHLLK